MRLLYLSLLVVFLCCSCATQGYAQQTDSITSLKEIVIAKIAPTDLLAPQTLEREQLERINSYSVADALRYLAGVKIKDYGGLGGLKTVDVRNMGTQHVGVFYNGIQVGNAQNGIVDLGRFSLDNVETIQLYNGQRSRLLQAAKEQASASTIYLQSKKPTFRVGEKYTASFQYKMGSIQLVNPSFHLNVKVNEKISTSFNAEYLYSNGDYKFRQKRWNTDGSVAYDTLAHRKNSGIEAYRFENTWFGQDEKNTWQANLYYYQSDRGLPGAVIKKSHTTAATENNNEHQADKNVMVQAEWTRVVSPHYQFMLKGKFAYDLMQYQSRKTVDFEGEEVTYNPQFDNTFYQQDWYVSAAHLLKLNSIWNVSMATDIQYNKLNATRLGQGTPFTFPERYTFYTALASSLDLGKVKVQANVLGTFTQEKVKYNYQAPNQARFMPSLFLSYKPWDNHQFDVHSFYKHSLRLPSFNDLYYTQIGTANLKPEYARQINFGFSYSKEIQTPFLKAINLSVETYYAHITDKIIASPTSSMMRWMMTNLGKVENYGIETQLGTTWYPIQEVAVNLGVTYEYTVAKDMSVTPAGKPSYYGDQIPYAPWHSGSSIVGVNYKGWALNYSFIYVGKRYNGNKNNSQKNEIQPWYTHDLSLQKTMKWKTTDLKWGIEAINLANQYYEVVTNFPMPGRNFRFTLRIDL